MTQAAAGVVSFDEALRIVMSHAAELPQPATETLPLLDCGNRVLAEPVLADRDQPPFDRSTRDGFAVRASEFGDDALKIAGQVRAGELWQGGALAAWSRHRDHDRSAGPGGRRCRRDGGAC